MRGWNLHYVQLGPEAILSKCLNDVCVLQVCDCFQAAVTVTSNWEEKRSIRPERASHLGGGAGFWTPEQHLLPILTSLKEFPF